jgi:hypothetical protein
MGEIALEHLERFAGNDDVEDIAEGRGYRAVLAIPGNRRATRLRIDFPDGKVSILSYSYLQEIICSNHQNLSLIFTSSVITLQGRNLWDLLDHLQSDRARILRCYHPQRYPEAPGPDDPVILSITRQSLRDFAMAAESAMRQPAQGRGTDQPHGRG